MTMNEKTEEGGTSLSDEEQQLAARLSTLLLEGLVEAFDPQTGLTDAELAAEIRSKLEHAKPSFVRIGLNLAGCLRFTESGKVYDASILALHAQLRGGPVGCDEEDEELVSSVDSSITSASDPELRAWNMLSYEEQLQVTEWMQAVQDDALRRSALYHEVIRMLFHEGRNYLSWFRENLSEEGKRRLGIEGYHRANTFLFILEPLVKEMRELEQKRKAEAEVRREACRAEKAAAKAAKQAQEGCTSKPDVEAQPQPKKYPPLGEPNPQGVPGSPQVRGRAVPGAGKKNYRKRS